MVCKILDSHLYCELCVVYHRSNWCFCGWYVNWCACVCVCVQEESLDVGSMSKTPPNRRGITFEVGAQLEARDSLKNW